MPEITKIIGAFLTEAAAVCLAVMGHKPGVILKVGGAVEEHFMLDWGEEAGLAEISSWGDLREAVEYGAVGVALVLVDNLLKLNRILRSEQGSGIDFLIEVTENDKQVIAGLEVSGILKESSGNSIEIRINRKLQQVRKFQGPNSPSYIFVVEFGQPKAKILKK